MKTYRIILIIIALFLLPSNTLNAPQKTQNSESAKSQIKQEKKPWYKKATNWMLVTGAALGTVLTGAVVRQQWQKYEQTSFKKAISAQTDIDALETLGTKYRRLMAEDINLKMRYQLKRFELAFQALDDPANRQFIKQIILDYINRSDSTQTAQFKLLVLQSIEAQVVQDILQNDREVKVAIKANLEPSSPMD